MPAPAASKIEDNICIIEGCFKPQAKALKRGLCMTCYSKAKKQVENGISWERLAEMNLCWPVETDDPFAVALNKALQVGGRYRAPSQ